MIKVGMADLNVCRAPEALTTLGLGSCIGACLYDPTTKIAGMVHYMLPDSTRITSNQNIAKFGDTGIREVLKKMELMGALRTRIVAKIAGGATMFAVTAGAGLSSLNVGSNNIESARKNLAALGIRIIAEDVGLNYGRTIEFFADDGRLTVKAIGKAIKTI
ncbi:MAG: chemotaxis protein CheD [Butyrivibrio sp.]|nr:chemotaxis protein CheD [Butyrivibrio sp.]